MARLEGIKDFRCFIDGEWVTAQSGEVFDSHDPFTAKVWARIPKCDARDVDRAVEAARRAFDGGDWPALNATQHQSIRFQLTDYTLARAANTTGALQGQLTINGQTRPITVPVQFADAAGALRVTGRYPLAMKDWGVQPPRLMMGTLKVGDTVTVNFDLLLQP